MTSPLIFDGHLDLAMNALRHERDQRRSIEAIRQREAAGNPDDRGRCSVALPQLRAGKVAVVVSTVIARCRPWADPGRTILRNDLDFPDPTIAYAAAQGELAYYRLLETLGEIRVLQTAGDLKTHWADWCAGQTSRIGVIITMEGADSIVDVEQLNDWRTEGLSTLMLAHFGHSRYAAGTPARKPANEYETDGPLTELGMALLKKMDELAMPLDLTHLSDRSFHQACEHFQGRLYSSHTACRALANLDRNHSDEQIRAIVERDGVIGVPMCNAFLNADYHHDGHVEVAFADVADHLDHLCQLAGSAQHAAIGSDLDGGFGAERSPAELETCADLKQLAETLAKCGYGDDDIASVMHGNWLRFFLETLPQDDCDA